MDNNNLRNGGYYFERLRGKENFALWQSSMRDELRLCNCWDILDGTTVVPDIKKYNIPQLPQPPPPTPDNADQAARDAYEALKLLYERDLEAYKAAYKIWKDEFDKYEQKSNKCMVTIKRSLMEDPLGRVIHLNDPLSMWNTLEAAYKDDGVTASLMLAMEILNNKYDGVSDFEVFMDKFMGKINKLQLMDPGLRDREKIHFLLHAMPPLMGNFVGVIVQKIKAYTPQAFTNLQKALQMEAHRAAAAQKEEMALVAQNQPSNNNPTSGQFNPTIQQQLINPQLLFQLQQLQQQQLLQQQQQHQLQQHQLQQQALMASTGAKRARDGSVPKTCSQCSKRGHDITECWEIYPQKKLEFLKKRDERIQRELQMQQVQQLTNSMSTSQQPDNQLVLASNQTQQSSSTTPS